MKTMYRWAIVLLTAGVFWPVSPSWAAGEAAFTEEFDVDDCDFSDRGRNPFFSIEPGDQLFLAGNDDGSEVRLRIRVLNTTKWIRFDTSEGDRLWVRTRVVEEREWVDEELLEVSRNFYARCKQTNDIFYFGEEVDFYENGRIVRHDGSWRAGVDGALPGLIMPGRFLLGSRYFQEIAPGVALDRAENVEMGLELDLPVGLYDGCVKILETTPLEPGAESEKLYCEEIGLVSDGPLELVDFRIRSADGWWDGPDHAGR